MQLGFVADLQTGSRQFLDLLVETQPRHCHMVRDAAVFNEKRNRTR